MKNLKKLSRIKLGTVIGGNEVPTGVCIKGGIVTYTDIPCNQKCPDTRTLPLCIAFDSPLN